MISNAARGLHQLFPQLYINLWTVIELLLIFDEVPWFLGGLRKVKPDGAF